MCLCTVCAGQPAQGPAGRRLAVQLHGRAAPAAVVAEFEPEGHGPLPVAGDDARESLDDPVAGRLPRASSTAGLVRFAPRGRSGAYEASPDNSLVGRGRVWRSMTVHRPLPAEDEHQPARRTRTAAAAPARAPPLPGARRPRAG